MTRRRMLWTLLAPVAPFVFVSLVGAQAPDGRWVRLAPYPQPTQEIGGAVANGKLYILGAYGANAPGGLAGWFNEYDPATDRVDEEARHSDARPSPGDGRLQRQGLCLWRRYQAHPDRRQLVSDEPFLGVHARDEHLARDRGDADQARRRVRD